MKKRVLSIDIETYSSNEIRYGVHKYVDAPDFSILLFAYAFDDEPVRVVDFARGEMLPPNVESALSDSSILKVAFNAAFEITCLKKFFNAIEPEQWECTSVLSLYNALPPGLGPTALALGFPQDKQKDTRGKALIRYFCQPCAPTKANGGRTRNRPEDAPEKWEEFKEYCRQDVVVERAIRERLQHNRPSPAEHELWQIDYGINTHGIKLDRQLVTKAIKLTEDIKTLQLDRMKALTGLENPNSIGRLSYWVEQQTGQEIESLNKAKVQELLDSGELSGEVEEVLKLRQQTGRASVKKYHAMENSVCEDGRIHDLFQFYGAHRTGRWAGRNVQLQNLRRNDLPDLDGARNDIKELEADDLSWLYEDVPDVLSQLLRTALVAEEGSRFIVADFSAIEARVIAWMAGEKWRMDVFENGGDIYCASASQMFGVPVEKHGVNGHLRQKGKVAELALGYNGGPAALIAMGALDMGLTENELPGIVTAWRKASPNIVKFWKTMEQAAMHAIRTGGQVLMSRYQLLFFMLGDDLMLSLPNGRRLCYPKAGIGVNRFGNESVTYYGLDREYHKWTKCETYGGKLVENCVQAVARDCLGEAMHRLNREGYKIVAHVHDEVIIEAPKDKGSLEEVIRIMTENADWNKGLKMNAAGFEADYYMKD